VKTKTMKIFPYPPNFVKLTQDEWDADSEDEKPKVEAVAPPPKPKKSVKQAIAEREERERQEAEEKALRRVTSVAELLTIGSRS
jgi:DUF438 domain-containing protein